MLSQLHLNLHLFDYYTQLSKSWKSKRWAKKPLSVAPASTLWSKPKTRLSKEQILAQIERDDKNNEVSISAKDMAAEDSAFGKAISLAMHRSR